MCAGGVYHHFAVDTFEACIYVQLYCGEDGVIDEGGCWSANMHIVWLARQSHLITEALRDGTKGQSSGSND